jgi:cephalosporin-C deacetylase-like acetyl esterase
MRPVAHSLAVLVLLAVTAANAGAQSAPPVAAPSAGASRDRLFDYAAGSTTCSRPPAGAQGGATLVIAGPGAAKMNAMVITPTGSLKKAPAVLWVHWLGEVATTNHTEFETDALDLAKHGVVSMLVDMPWSQKDWFNNVRTTDSDYADTIAEVIALRRALDCMVAIPGVDQTRIAYVGHDFGAMVGALLLAVDNRPSYAVFMAPTLSFWEWYLLGKQPTDRAAYVSRMSVFDLPGWLAKGKQKATLLQVGQLDEYVSQSTGIAIRNAIPEHGRTLRAFRLDHALDDETAHEDRLAWLTTQLQATP